MTFLLFDAYADDIEYLRRDAYATDDLPLRYHAIIFDAYIIFSIRYVRAADRLRHFRWCSILLFKHWSTRYYAEDVFAADIISSLLKATSLRATPCYAIYDIHYCCRHLRFFAYVTPFRYIRWRFSRLRHTPLLVGFCSFSSSRYEDYFYAIVTPPFLSCQMSLRCHDNMRISRHFDGFIAAAVFFTTIFRLRHHHYFFFRYYFTMSYAAISICLFFRAIMLRWCHAIDLAALSAFIFQLKIIFLYLALPLFFDCHAMALLSRSIRHVWIVFFRSIIFSLLLLLPACRHHAAVSYAMPLMLIRRACCYDDAAATMMPPMPCLRKTLMMKMKQLSIIRYYFHRFRYAFHTPPTFPPLDYFSRYAYFHHDISMLSISLFSLRLSFDANHYWCHFTLFSLFSIFSLFALPPLFFFLLSIISMPMFSITLFYFVITFHAANIIALFIIWCSLMMLYWCPFSITIITLDAIIRFRHYLFLLLLLSPFSLMPFSLMPLFRTAFHYDYFSPLMIIDAAWCHDISLPLIEAICRYFDADDVVSLFDFLHFSLYHCDAAFMLSIIFVATLMPDDADFHFLHFSLSRRWFSIAFFDISPPLLCRQPAADYRCYFIIFTLIFRLWCWLCLDARYNIILPLDYVRYAIIGFIYYFGAISMLRWSAIITFFFFSDDFSPLFDVTMLSILSLFLRCSRYAYFILFSIFRFSSCRFRHFFFIFRWRDFFLSPFLRLRCLRFRTPPDFSASFLSMPFLSSFRWCWLFSSFDIFLISLYYFADWCMMFSILLFDEYWLSPLPCWLSSIFIPLFSFRWLYCRRWISFFHATLFFDAIDIDYYAIFFISLFSADDILIIDYFDARFWDYFRSRFHYFFALLFSCFHFLHYFISLNIITIIDYHLRFSFHYYFLRFH